MSTDVGIEHKNGSWTTKEFRDSLAAMQKEMDKAFIDFMITGRLPIREPKEDDNVKLAYVLIKGNQTMIGCDNKTLKGYKLKDTCPMWVLPLEEIQYDSFVRWCTSFDT